VWDEENEREIILLTNHLDFGATTIADIYKERWQIELFFKALKIKSFVGTSENALRIQIWTALIAILLLKWLHHLSRARLVLQQPRLPATPKPVHLPRFTPVAQRPLQHPTPNPTRRATPTPPHWFRTGNATNQKEKNRPHPQKLKFSVPNPYFYYTLKMISAYSTVVVLDPLCRQNWLKKLKIMKKSIYREIRG